MDWQIEFEDAETDDALPEYERALMLNGHPRTVVINGEDDLMGLIEQLACWIDDLEVSELGGE